jgi:hypothetical protein
MVRVLSLTVLLGFFVSCMESHSCTEIGCIDAAGVTIRTESGEWAEGVYTLRIAFDGEEYECGFDMPGDLPEVVGQRGELDCEPRLEASFTPRVECTESSDGNSSSQSCTPIERQFDLEVFTQGTPAALDVKLDLDGMLLVDESHDLVYEEYFPNGPECGPACRQANVEIDIP